MSWSIAAVGTKEDAKKSVADQMDKVAANYAGKPEADDVRACRDRILGLIEATALGKEGETDWNAVKVFASGSHSWIEAGIISATFTVNVSRTNAS